MISPVLFYIFGGFAVAMVLLMIFLPNPVASAMCLVFALFCLSGLYVLLSAPFVAILQVLVYAGAIMVLFVFVIMLLDLQPEHLAEDKIPIRKALISLFAFGFAGFLIHYFFKLPVNPFPEVPADFGAAEPIGRLMFTTYLVPFELISLLLLVAIIGAVLLGKREEP